MYGTNITGGLTFARVLGGISKALGIANQAIPIYKEIKPMVGNARKVLSVMKEFNNSTKSSIKKTINTDIKKEVTNNVTPKVVSTTNPVFFQ